MRFSGGYTFKMVRAVGVLAVLGLWAYVILFGEIGIFSIGFVVVDFGGRGFVIFSDGGVVG